MGILLKSWQFYTFPFLFGIGSCAYEKTGNYSEFLLWLKWTGDYPASKVNYYATAYTAWGILGCYILVVYSDLTRCRFIIQPIVLVTVAFSSILLLVWDIPVGLKWFAYIISGWGYAVQVTNVSGSLARV